MSANQFEQAARAKKVAALVAHFDRFLIGAGLDLYADAFQLIRSLEAMKPEVWEHHAIAARLTKPPSDTTKREVIAVYQGRVVEHEIMLANAAAPTLRIGVGA
jgi:hypothetical protein